MTAWQNQPPRTRRQVRMNERDASVDAPFNLAQTQTDVSPFDGFPQDTADTAAHSTSEGQPRFDTSQVTDASAAPSTPTPAGRRAQRAADAPPSQPAEADQSWRPRDFRPRDSSLREPGIQRDIAADGRGQSFSTTGVESAGVESAGVDERAVAPSAPVWPLKEPSAFMPSEPPRPANPPLAESAPVAAPDGAATFTVEPAVPTGRALTRRELRALEAARNPQPEPEAQAPASAPLFEAAPEAVAAPEFPAAFQPETAPEAAPTPSFEFVSGVFTLAKPAAPQGPAPLWLPEGVTMPAPEPAPAPAPAPQPLYDFAPPTGSPIDLSMLSVPSAPETMSPGMAEFPVPSLSELPALSLADLPAPQTGGFPAPQLFEMPPPSATEYPAAPQFSEFPLPLAPQFEQPEQQGSESDRGVDFAPQVFTAPVGHWTTQEAIDDFNQLTDSAPARDVSTASGPITSNALVLPAIPQGADMSVPFDTTGEVLITGTINLPSSYGTTGAHPARYDHSDLDAIIDAVDRDDVEGDSAPVRAIRAVSTHTSPRDIIAATKPSGGNRLPVILAITAGAMMVSVAVLFIAGLIFKIF